MSPIELDPVRDLRTFVDGDVLRLAGSGDRGAAHARAHARVLVLPRSTTTCWCCSGDLVFAGTIGRSDFHNSDPVAMRASLARFLTLPDDLRVLPGHGAETVVGRERASNPFLQGVG